MKKLTSLILTLAMVVSILGANIFTPITTQAETTINIGDYVQMGNYYQPILWRCVDIDENGPLMLADKIITCKPFDGAGTHKYLDGTPQSEIIDFNNRARIGSNVWETSNMRCWLNSTETASNITWLDGCPPSANSVYLGYNAYSSEKGFLTDGNFTQLERDAIKSVTQKSLLNESDSVLATIGYEYHHYDENILNVVQNYDTAYAHNVTDKMFLLDVKQLNRVYQNSAYLGTSYHIGQFTPQAVTNSCDWNQSNTYWIRSPMSVSNMLGFPRYVDNNGNVTFGYGAADGRGGVRPAFYLNQSSANFSSGNGALETPYVVSAQTTSIPMEAIIFNGHTYMMEKSSEWKLAKARCESLGGHLVTITSADEQAFIERLMKTGNCYSYWIGGTDEGSEGNWQWITGEPFNYTNWNIYEPNNGCNAGSQNYSHIYAQNNIPIWSVGTWDDCWNDKGEADGLICEWDTIVTPSQIMSFTISATSSVSNGVLNVDATVKNNSTDPITPSVAISIYNNSGKLINIKIDSQPYTAGGEKIINYKYNCISMSDKYYKVFVLDGLTNIRPLALPYDSRQP